MKKQSRWTPKNLMLIFGGSAAICGVIVYSQAAFVPDLARKFLTLSTTACLFLAYQQFCRYRIHADINSLGGQVDSVYWRPFQGAFFSRGWHVQRIYTFLPFNVGNEMEEKKRKCVESVGYLERDGIGTEYSQDVCFRCEPMPTNVGQLSRTYTLMLVSDTILE